MKKGFVFGLIFLFLLQGFVVFANGSRDASSSSEMKEGTTELRVAWWGNKERNEKYYAINALFEEENPGVKIVTDSPGWTDYWTKMATQYASGSAPDVVQFQANQIGEYCSKGVLVPLQKYVDDGTIDLSAWNMEFISTGNYEDVLYMITIGLTAQCSLFNKTWLDEMGIDLWGFEEDITWDEFQDFLRDVRAEMPENTYPGLGIYFNNDLGWNWIRQKTKAGEEWVDSNGNFAPTSEVLSEWFQYSKDMTDEGIFPPVTWNEEWRSKSWSDSALVHRKVVYTSENANKYKLFQEYTEDELVIRRPPIDPAAPNPYADVLITSALGISETSKAQDLAAEYINFFVNDPRAQKIFNAEVGVPGSYDAQELLEPDLVPQEVKHIQYLNMLSKNAIPFMPKPEGIWAIQNEMTKIGIEVSIGAKTADEAAQFLIDIANDTIK